MKFEKIYIKGFGKLNNYELNFTDGFNLIYGENEAGKSTVSEFIKMMFYGSGKASSSIVKSPRKRYVPIKGDEYGGYIEFSHEGVRYRLERDFKKSDSTDRVTLYNLNSGEKENLPSNTETGERFFSMSASAFSQSVFVGGLINCSTDSDAASEIGGKLANLVSSGDEAVSFNSVVNRLSDARQYYMSKSGKKGVYDQLKVKLSELREELYAARSRDEEKRNLNMRITGLKKQISDLQKSVEIARNDISLSEKAEKGAKLKSIIDGYNELDRLKLEADEMRKKLTSGSLTADEEYISSIADLLAALKSIKERENADDIFVSPEDEAKRVEIEASLKADTGRLDALKQRRAETEALCLEYKNDTEKYTPHRLIWLFIIGLLLVLGGGAVYYFIKPLFALPVAAVGTIAAVLGLCVKVTPKKAKKATENAEKLSSELASLDSEISALTDKTDAAKLLFDSLSKEGKEKERKEQLEREKKTVTDKLFVMLNPFGAENDYDSVLSTAAELKKIYDAVHTADAKYEATARMCEAQGDIEKAKAELEALGEIPEGAENIKTSEKLGTINRLSVKITEYSADLSAAETTLTTAFVGKKSTETVEDEIRETEEKLREGERYCATLDVAYDALKEAYEELRGSFGPKLNDLTAKFMSSLTDGAYGTAYVSKDLTVGAEKTDGGNLLDWQYMSSGTADQCYLALRLAVAELIGDEAGTLPVILDDPFIQYDDARTEKGCEFLGGYAENRQVIMFTCKNKIRQLSETNGAAVSKL